MRLVGPSVGGLIALLAVASATAQTPAQPPAVQKPPSTIQVQPRVTAPKPAPPATDGLDSISAAQLVMLESSKSAQEDLKAIMAGVKAANAAGTGATARNSRAPGAPCSGQTTADWRACLLQIEAKVSKLPPDPERAALMRSIKDSIDSMSEMGEQSQLDLRKAMEQQSRLQQQLSNLLKQISDTANTITQNLK